MLKPIETIYNDYKFRSRLEARWAVFFDSLDIEYRYEPEGFDLDGTWYLPDFWLPEQEYWIEIKAEKPSHEEKEKASKLAYYSKKPVFIIYGDPWATDLITWLKRRIKNWKTYRVIGFFGINLSHRLGEFFDHFSFERQFEELIKFLHEQQKDLNINFSKPIPSSPLNENKIAILIELDKEYYMFKYGKEHPKWKYWISEDNLIWVDDPDKGLVFNAGHSYPWGETETEKLLNAYKSARQAQFEHGKAG